MNNSRLSKYLICAIIATIISIGYWSAFSINSYNTFHEYSDLGGYAYDFYYHINYPSSLHGLQYLVFSNHIAPDLLMFLPFFAVFPSAITLLIIQDVLISITGLLVFLIARDLLSNERTAFLLSLAFFINLGIISLFVFDFHAEAFIPLYMLLTFYFFIKKRKILFFVSTLLLVGSMDVAPFIAFMLGLALFIYSLSISERRALRKEQLLMAISLMAIAIITLLLYNVISSNLTSAYLSNNYPNLPISFRVIAYNSEEFHIILSAFSGTGIPGTNIQVGLSLIVVLLVVFFGFGIAAIFEPVTMLILIFPWLFELYVLAIFSFLFDQYLGLVIGSAMVATLISLMNFQRLPEKVNNPGKLYSLKKRAKKYSDYSIILSTIILFILFLYIIHFSNVEDLAQLLTFHVSQPQHTYDKQLSNIISTIPNNASVMAPYFVMSHMFKREYLELIPASENLEIISSNTIGTRFVGIYPRFIPEYVIESSDPYMGGINPVSEALGDNVSISDLDATYNGNYVVYESIGNTTVLLNENGR